PGEIEARVGPPSWVRELGPALGIADPQGVGNGRGDGAPGLLALAEPPIGRLALGDVECDPSDLPSGSLRSLGAPQIPQPADPAVGAEDTELLVEFEAVVQGSTQPLAYAF